MDLSDHAAKSNEWKALCSSCQIRNCNPAGHSFKNWTEPAEYETFIVLLRFTNKLKFLELHIFSDSKLVVNQVIGKFEDRGAKMTKYLAVVKNLITRFKVVKIEQVGRDLNLYADTLAGLALVFKGETSRTIVVDLISAPSYEIP